jgi:hypothetical protein
MIKVGYKKNIYTELLIKTFIKNIKLGEKQHIK